MSAVRVGIPRGLLFFKFRHQWALNLNAGRVEITISPETTEDILADGIMHSLSDLCLPVKAFFGHVIALKDRVEYLFIPRIIRIEPSAYLCPKVIGLPDMVRAAIRDLPPIIDTEFNIKEKTPEEFWHEVWAGLKIGSGDTYLGVKTAGDLPEPNASIVEVDGRRLTIGVAGRPYLVLDNHINKGVIRYMKELGTRVCFLHNLDQRSIRETMEKLPKWVYWSIGKEVVSSVRIMLEDDAVDGIILLSNAGCGPDSFLVELIERALPVHRKPYMNLTIDEHSSDAGLKTRIEAFVDMVERNSKFHVLNSGQRQLRYSQVLLL